MDTTLHVTGAIIGAFYILFMPGFALSYLFFARGKVDVVERIALSFALSVAVVPLVTFYLNLVGVKIKFWSVFLEVAFIILAAGIAAKLTGKLEKPNAHEYKKRG
jgi:uncharacterized membrane protein